MSYDLYIWRRHPGAAASDSLIFAMIAEDLEVGDLAPLDPAPLIARLDVAFPAWASAEEPSFQCVFSNRYVAVETWSSTPDDVFQSFSQICSEEGLRLFDPQTENVPEADTKTAKRLAARQRRAERKRLARNEIAELESRATQGDAEAQYELGNRYAFGDGVRSDATKAFHWYERAASAGSSGGMFNLAACYHRGDGAARNLPKAIEWYERALASDKMLAPFALGEIFSDESMRDYSRAKEYFRVALENGHPDADAALRLLESDTLTEDEKRRAWRFWTRD